MMQDQQPPKTPLTIPSWNGLHTSSKFFLQTSLYGQQCGHMGYICEHQKATKLATKRCC
ncbi:hypothetical protein BDL97_04G061100 [Sphagnum fallax]|nr:hypothetical protein BDL97_04G061100 [Sphagnum fallax]